MATYTPNPVVSSLPQYVKVNADQLAYKAATGAKTLAHIRKQAGIFGKGAINVVTPNIVFNGSQCGFNDTSSSEITQRYITTGLMIVNETFCDEQVVNTYMEMLFNANGHLEDSAFFEKFVGANIEAINKELDKLLWQGDTSNSDPFDGILKGITTDGVATSLTLGTALSATITPAQVYADVLEMVVAMKADTLTNGKGVIFMGEDIYTKLVVGLVSANLYHYPAEGVADGLIIPGTNIKAVGVHGLTGQYKMVAGESDNIVFGTGFDEGNRKEQFLLFWDEGDQIWKFIVKFSAGVNTIFPDEIVVGA